MKLAKYDFPSLYMTPNLFFFRGHAVYRLHVEFRRIKNSHSEGKQLLATNYWYVPLNKPRSEIFHLILFACLFGVNLPLDDFSLIWRRHHYRWRTLNFDLYLAFMAIEQWGFYIDKLWHCDKTNGIKLEWSSPRTGTLTPVAERLAVELSLPVFRSD